MASTTVEEPPSHTVDEHRVQVVANGICLVQVYTQCTPVGKRWDPADPGNGVNRHVHVDFGYVQGGELIGPETGTKSDSWLIDEALNTCTALCLSLIPACKVCHLKVSSFQHICISLLLGVGAM